MSSGSELINRRLEKLRSIRAGGHDPYPAHYDLTHEIPRILESFSHLEAAELEAAGGRFEPPAAWFRCGAMARSASPT
jgi:lysyl-tRNA synthetase class II